ncbi:receptor-like protein EIX2 [Quercus lobata]|uniref:receptor-like protein EIX2 n=1 Tax=Quercus lobata TaxID=97700 RepID=UPI0012473A7E|nr:receptor-like protein EIX2 [Quercus lobata]XP_030933341.1 receptor-like protein EIX2 [Quercus lobata]
MLFLHLKSALAFTSGLGDDSVKCIEKEREALLEFKKGFAEGYQGKLSSWGNEDEKNCCNWDGIYCNNQTGTQIQIANPLGFIGNLALCGPPLTPKCPGDAKPNVESPKGGSKNYQEDEDEFLNCLYIGMGLGFIVGFWGVCGSLMLNRSWRHLYFQTISNLNDWLQVAMIVNIARMQRMFQG